MFGSFNINGMCTGPEGFKHLRKLQNEINAINEKTSPEAYKKAINAYNQYAGEIGCPGYQKGQNF